MAELITMLVMEILVMQPNKQSRTLQKPMSGFLEHQFITHFLVQH